MFAMPQFANNFLLFQSFLFALKNENDWAINSSKKYRRKDECIYGTALKNIT
jgi:hypothetical protein